MRKVSVIVPIFEVERYIEDCLLSIQAQTYHNIEVICVNDFTLDNSVTVARNVAHADRRIRFVHHERNRGLGAARNTGLAHATGEYVKFVDSDDMLPPHAIETLVGALERTGADWALAGFSILGADGSSFSRSPFHTEEMERIGQAGWIDIGSNPLLLNDMWPSGWMGLWRAEMIEKSGASFPEALYFEDHKFFFEHGFAVESAVYVPSALYTYRGERAGQITRETSPKVFDIFLVLEQLEPVFRRHLEGDTLLRFAARNSLRLIAERTWTMPKEGALINSFRDRASEFLRRYPMAILEEVRDWYIPVEDLRLLTGNAALSHLPTP